MELTINDKAALSNEIDILLQFSPLAAVVLDTDKRIVASNSAASIFFKSSHESLHSSRISDFVRTTDRTFLATHPDNSERSSRGEQCEISFSDGTSIPAELFISPLPEDHLLVLANDLSDRKNAERKTLASEKQRWKMQKTESLEKLAGGIAHDFNNFLAVILLQTDMINLQLPDDSQLLNRVNEIKAVANDAASIVRQLLAFGRRQAMNPAPAVLNKLIEAAGRDLKALLGENIEMALELDPALGVTFIDQHQIAQAVMYLIMNARDAMPNGGRLTIRTSNIDKGGRLIHKTQANGSYVQIEVVDTGIGLDPKMEEHIFEPFYSTKGRDKSAGLSLATVYGIVKQSGGYIWVDSVPNKGSSFRIQFPRIDEARVGDRDAKPTRAKSKLETILLVDDEISVRKVAAEGLRQSGYRVLEAANAADALEIARTFPDPIDLILADLMMPGIGGAEAAKRIKQFQANARVLFISGDPGNRIDEGLDGTEFLSKPFTLANLTSKVVEILSN